VSGREWHEVSEDVAVSGATLWTSTRGAGVPVVLAHGGPGLSNNLGPVAEMIAGAARVHLYDQRGGGRSSRHGPFDVRTFVEDLEALRRHWGHDKWIVGGHSWGAALALFYALEHRDRTKAVVYLSGTSPRWDFPERVRAERMRRLDRRERRELETLRARINRGEGDDADETRYMHLNSLTDFATRRNATEALARGPLFEFPRSRVVNHALQDDWKARLDQGIEDDLRVLETPVLVVHGDHDPDPRGAREVAELLPNAEWAPIEGAGHSPWLERPEQVRRRLRAFLR
jgi:proline iminopeptidase